MAITTNDQLVAALAAAAPNANRMPYVKTALAGTFTLGTFVSLWTAPGQPGAGATPTAFGSGGNVPTSATVGALSFTNPAAGNSYLGRLFATSSVAGTLILYDRLWACSALLATTNAAQTIVSAPALTRPDANGINAEIWIETTTAIGTTASNVSCSYTNQAGVAGHATTSQAMIVSQPIGWAMQLPLLAGDTGVQTIQTLTFSAAMTAGAVNLVIQRRIAEFALPGSFIPYLPPQDPIWTGLAQVYNNACIGAYFLIGAGTAAPAIPTASVVLAQG